MVLKFSVKLLGSASSEEGHVILCICFCFNCKGATRVCEQHGEHFRREPHTETGRKQRNRQRETR